MKAPALRGRARVEAEIETVERALEAFAQTDQFDSGVRLAQKESYLLGLQRALRWMNQEAKP